MLESRGRVRYTLNKRPLVKRHTRHSNVHEWLAGGRSRLRPLGASSALLIALSHALRVLKSGSDRLSDEEIIRVGAKLEAQTTRVPTGKQDYYAATYGGVNSIWFSVGESRVEGCWCGSRILPPSSPG